MKQENTIWLDKHNLFCLPQLAKDPEIGDTETDIDIDIKVNIIYYFYLLFGHHVAKKRQRHNLLQLEWTLLSICNLYAAWRETQ